MDREERKRGELVGEKLKRGILVGKREGNSTPTWKFGLIQPDDTLLQDSTNSKNIFSARKLGANLWEMQHQLNLRVEKMSTKNGPILSHHKQDNIFEAQAQSPSKQPRSGNKLKKQLEPSLTQHNLRVEKIRQAQQPLSPASYCSSMEMAPYRPGISPNSSLASNRKFGESSHGLEKSMELLKVLNRIWSLEEKHALDMSLVKTLKSELGQSQAQIQELLQEKKRDKIEIDNLTEQNMDLKVVRKKDQDRIKDAVKLVEEKLENELKLRRHSEKHYRKLAKELSEIKSSFSNALKELEREKKARTLLEDLCDEFAKGIRDYEQEVRFMKQKSNEGQILREENDRFIVHISEAWLDERMQMKFHDISEKQTPLDKLCFEIEAFLREKQSGKDFGKNDYSPLKNPCESARSMDTFHLNEPASAPWKANEEEDSVGIISNQSLKQANAFAGRQGHFGNFTSDDRVKKTTKPKSIKSKTDDLYETSNPRMPRKGDMMQRSSWGGRNSTTDANLDLQDTIRNSSFNFIEGSFEPSMFTGPSSPLKKWVSKVSAADPEIAESSSRWAKGIKPNTLKAKLIEARLEGKQSRARASKSSPKRD